MSQRTFSPKKSGPGRRFNGRKKIDDMYGEAWEKYRKRFLALNPECYACGWKAVVVDHLVPHQGDEMLFRKLDNHIPLCISCHNTVTSLFDRKHVTGTPVTEKIKWLNSGRIPGADGWHPRRIKVLASYEGET